MKQPEALDILKMGHNVFLTGFAGSGKTFLLNQYIDYLRENNVNVGITASTGIASTHMGGRTIHSWCGMGIKDKMTKTEIKSILEKPYIYENVVNSKVLIIDEISMLGHRRLDLVDNICRIGRNNDEPFGGLQVILAGDFFQLPPIDKLDKFATKSSVWQNMDLKICYLDEQFRQSDEKFLKILNDIRANKTSEQTRNDLMSRLNKNVSVEVTPTKLYTHNIDVDSINDIELSKIDNEMVEFHMVSDGIPNLVKALKDGCLAPGILKLKVGAVVMFVRNNFGKNYVNGTLGRVIGFDEDDDYPIVETNSGYEIVAFPETWTIESDNDILAKIVQVPLRLAWAISVHKSQGMSLEFAEIDLSKSFERGMGYVALSRVQSLQGINLRGINDLALEVNQEVVEKDKEFIKKSLEDLKELKKMNKSVVKKIQEEYLESIKPVEYIPYSANNDEEISIEDMPF